MLEKLLLDDFFGRNYIDVDVIEEDDNYVIMAELPGMKEDDFEVLLDNGVLTIRGEKKPPNKDAKYRVAEIRYGKFERKFKVYAEDVDATYKNGLLTITIPKANTRNPKAIPIKFED